MYQGNFQLSKLSRFSLAQQIVPISILLERSQKYLFALWRSILKSSERIWHILWLLSESVAILMKKTVKVNSLKYCNRKLFKLYKMHEHSNECTLNATILFRNLMKTFHKWYLFSCASEDRGKTNILRNGVDYLSHRTNKLGLLRTRKPRSYHLGHSLESQLCTSWKVVQCHWQSWPTLGNCTDFLSPILWKNFHQKQNVTEQQEFPAEFPKL